MRLRLLTPLLLLAASAASAQAPTGSVVVEPHGGRTQRASFPASAFTVEQRDVEEARCRSCRGRHTSYSVRVELPSGPIARVELFADVVGGATRFSTDSGPYPATAWVRVWPRGATDPTEVSGRIELEWGRGGTASHRVRFRASAPMAPVRAITFEVPRAAPATP